MLTKRSKYSLPPALGSAPWYMIPHGKHEQNQTFFNPVDGSLHHRSIPEMRKKTCLGCSRGYLMMLDKSSNECFLLGLNYVDVIPLPQPPTDLSFLHYFWISSSSPNAIGCTVVVVYHKQIIYCRLNDGHDKGWKSIEVGEFDSFSGGITSIQGNLYLHNRTGDFLKVIDVSSPVVEVEDLCAERIEGQYDTLHHKKALVEYDEELFIVILNFQRHDGLFINAEVYEFDFSEYIWERVESIGSDLAIFIGDNDFAYMTNDERVEGDCIYFMQPWYDGLRQYKFRLNERSFSHKVICHNLCIGRSGSYLVTGT